MPPPSALVVGTRIHWNNHCHDKPLVVDDVVAQVQAFCDVAATYAESIIIAVGVPTQLVTSAPDQSDQEAVFNASVREVVDRLVHWSRAPQAAGSAAIRILPMTFWGAFVPALNAIVETAVEAFPHTTHIVLQSLEIKVHCAGIHHLLERLNLDTDLVVGAALPGHDFAPSTDPNYVRELNGRTTPWNTLAIWNLRQLAKIGFLLVGDGIGVPGACASGVEEVSAIAVFQALFPHCSRAKVVAVPGLIWDVENFVDEERRRWQEEKMNSKLDRAARQMLHLGAPAGQVHHLS
ncbi:TPA: hypothetical protein N0F65_002018 [Lagenidium giganteum]|uniref:Uncharacterized protein n=1 Tax=Lagenidium giganteum TaxID=4803 RepID=A0AAV2Z2N8_9STRA|nr:TPA: hypothetical protein N0F65_002018 [Lagenidium giganteum]